MWVRDANNRSEPIPQQHRSNLFVHTLRTPASRESRGVHRRATSLLDAGTHRGDYPSSNGASLMLYFAAAASRSATSS
jgi:hypothetical protein